MIANAAHGATIQAATKQVAEKWGGTSVQTEIGSGGLQSSCEDSVGTEVVTGKHVNIQDGSLNNEASVTQQQLSVGSNQRPETLELELFPPVVVRHTDAVANSSRHSVGSVGYTVALEFPSDYHLDLLKQRLPHGAPYVPTSSQFEVTGSGINGAEGSSSTARLSVNSAKSTEDAGSVHRQQAGIPFFSASIFSPHTPQDMLELHRRLMGGYVDAESGREFLTPGQRWRILLQEAAMSERGAAPQFYDSYLTGAGILWVSPQDGLPGHLRVISKGDENATSGGGGVNEKKFETQYHQLLIQLSGFIPDLEDDVAKSEVSLCSYQLQKCVVRVKEFYSWCSGTSPFNPHHQRLRAILGQLQVSLRDTAILLEDPQLYLEAFARIDPQGLMFQAEVLSFLQQPRETEASRRCETGSPPPHSRVLRTEPLQAERLSATNPLQRSLRVEVPAPAPASTSSTAAHQNPNPPQLLAKKAKDVANLAMTTLGNSRFSNLPDSMHNSQQLETALGLFYDRAFRILDYILLVLRNTVTLDLVRRVEDG